MFKKIIMIGLVFPVFSYAGTFERTIHEIQVYDDRVRINIGTTYGTCEEREGWWGWYTSEKNSPLWLSLALAAQAQSKKVTVYDSQNSCVGPADAIGLEGLFLKSES